MPVIGIRAALHAAIWMMDTNCAPGYSVLARIKAQQVWLELVGNRGCKLQEEYIRLAVVERQPHTLQHRSRA